MSEWWLHILLVALLVKSPVGTSVVATLNRLTMSGYTKFIHVWSHTHTHTHRDRQTDTHTHTHTHCHGVKLSLS